MTSIKQSAMTRSAPDQPEDGTVHDDTNGLLRKGLFVTILLVGGFGAWSAAASLAGAVLTQGTVIVESNDKKIQHPTGGIVGEILVKDGDHVEVGDTLVRLDETVTRANLQIISKQMDELIVRKARLEAERDGLAEMILPAGATGRLADLMSGEKRLFDSRRAAREGQRSQLAERIGQLREQIVGGEGQLTAKVKELRLVRSELEGQKALWDKRLISVTKYIASQREEARLEGEKGQLISTNAQVKARIAETQLQILQIEQDLKSEVTKELRDIQAREAELAERRVAAEDQLQRIEIKAPHSGTIHQLAVHTIGGVISAGEPIMMIVPETDRLMIEAKVLPQDIDHVRPGQPSFIRFSAFNQRTTPEFRGSVERISADLMRDPQTNQSYYLARIALTPESEEQTHSLKLVPGMPAEVHISTGDRSVLSYFVKPLQDQLARTFKGD